MRYPVFQLLQTMLARYSLISIRQNYNFDMLAMIWHEIVYWFLKIYQDCCCTELFLFWLLDVQNNFTFPTMGEHAKVGKFSEINKQFHVKSWLTYQSCNSVWWILSCIGTKRTLIATSKNFSPIVAFSALFWPARLCDKRTEKVTYHLLTHLVDVSATKTKHIRIQNTSKFCVWFNLLYALKVRQTF